MKVLCLSICLLAVLVFSDARPASKRSLGSLLKRGGPGSEEGPWDHIDVDEDDVTDLAAAVSKELGTEVTPEDMENWLEDHGEEAEEIFYVVAAELDPEDFEEFEDLLAHPTLLKDMLATLAAEGLLDKKKKRMTLLKKALSKKGFKRSWDHIEVDDDDVSDLAAAVSKELGTEVTPEDMENWLEDHGDEAEEIFYVVAAELDPEDFEEFEDLLAHPNLLKDMLEKLAEEGLLDKKKKRMTLLKKALSKKGFKRSWDHIDVDDDDVSDLAAAVSKELGTEVTPEDMENWLEDHGDEAEEIFYVVAAELDPEDFEEFEDLLAHPTLLKDILEKLAEEGLLDKKKRTTLLKKALSKKGFKRSWDHIEIDDDDVSDLAAAVSKELGTEVTPEDMENWLEDHGDEAEEIFYVVAAELDPEDFEEFEDLLAHPNLLKDMLETLAEEGLLDKKKKRMTLLKKALSKKGFKRSWDHIEVDDDDVSDLAAAVSKELGTEVTPEDMENWLEDHGEEAEEIFYVVAAELDPEDFEEFEDLLAHPTLLRDLLGKLAEEGLI